MLDVQCSNQSQRSTTKRSKTASLKKEVTIEVITENVANERVTRSSRRAVTSSVKSNNCDYLEDKENLEPQNRSRIKQPVIALDRSPRLHQLLEQKLELTDSDEDCENAQIDKRPVQRKIAKTPSNLKRLKKQPSTTRKSSVEISVETQSVTTSTNSSPNDNKVFITPPDSGKKTRVQVRQTLSQSCSAVGRKRRGLFPGYERFQKVKSAFCPKQQFFDHSDSEDEVFDADDEDKETAKNVWSARDVIPGRKAELDRLESLVQELAENGKSSSIYISGPPGTGKSACVTAVLRQFRHTHGEDFAHVRIVNCVRCRTKESILQTIGCSADGKLLKSKTIGSKQKSGKGHRPIIVVLDEVDQVEVSHRTFIYEMFEWVSPKAEKGATAILLIAIANALDLTERVLPRLALSSVKPELMHYKPYSAAQLVDIIQDRISKVDGVDFGGSCVLDRGAIELCARKVSSATGDARKALELCRKAIEVVQREAMLQYQALHSLETPPTSPFNKTVSTSDNFSSRVTISVMNRVIAEAFSSWASLNNRGFSASVSSEQLTGDDSGGGGGDSCPLHHKVIITALARLTKQCSAAHFSIQQVLSKYSSVCSEKGISSLDQSQMLMVLDLLEARGLIQVTAPSTKKSSTADFKGLKVYIKGNLFELLSSTELDA